MTVVTTSACVDEELNFDLHSTEWRKRPMDT